MRVTVESPDVALALEHLGEQHLRAARYLSAAAQALMFAGVLLVVWELMRARRLQAVRP